MAKRRRPRREPRVTEIPKSDSGDGWSIYAPAGVTTLICYLNALNGYWVHDDVPAIVRNKDVLGSASFVNLFRNDFWGTPMADLNSHKSYRPLTTLTFRWNHEAAGLSPGWFHGTNILLHGVSSILVARLSLRVAGLQPAFAALAGALFAAHPVHTEAVTGIVGRADVLAALFFLLSFLAYHGTSGPLGNGCCPDGGGQLVVAFSQRRLSVWPSVFLGGAAMLAKETGVATLVVNLAYDFYRTWPHIKRSFTESLMNEETNKFLRRAAKVLISLSVLLVFRLAMLHGALPRFSNQDNPAAFHPCRHVRLLTFLYLASLNAWLMLCPATLSHDWQMSAVPLVPGLSDPRNICTCLLLVTCFVLLCRCLHDCETQRQPWLVLGFLVAVLPYLPASNLVVTVGFVLAERILYLPSVGFVLLVAGGAQALWRPATALRPFITTAITLILVTFATRTALRNKDWTNRESLARAGLKALPHNAKMHYNFANFLRDSTQLEQAAFHYREALRLWPSYASAHNNLGTLMTDNDEAESHFLAAIRYSPYHVNAHYNLGHVYRRVNRTQHAVEMLEKCISIDASYTSAYVLLARLYAAQGRQTAVSGLLSHLAKLQPDEPEPLTELAAWLATTGAHWAAVKQYQKALRISIKHPVALLGALRSLRALGQYPRAHQFMIRYHIATRPNGANKILYTGDLYLTGAHYALSSDANRSRLRGRQQQSSSAGSTSVASSSASRVNERTPAATDAAVFMQNLLETL